MDYIAIAVNENDCMDIERFCAIINNNVQLFGYDVIWDDYLHDQEVSNGLLSFVEVRNIKKLCVLRAYNDRNKTFASNEISQEIYHSMINNKITLFEKFIEALGSKISKMYFIFAYEWQNDSLIRYEEGDINKLICLIRHNFGWPNQLYNLKSNSYTPDLDTPFVFYKNH